MKFFLILFLTFLFLKSISSCSQNQEKKEPLPKKSLSYPKEVEKYLAIFPKLKESIHFDSTRLLDTNKFKNKIPLELVELLSKKLSKDELSEDNQHYFSAYKKIEDSKLDDKYEDFLKKLDIGMIQNAEVFSIGRWEVGDTLSFLLWNLTYESYPACPIFSGKHFFITLIYFDKIVHTTQIAGIEFSADAPVTAETFVLGTLTESLQLLRKKYVKVKEEEEIIEYGMTKEKWNLDKKLNWEKENLNGK
ncbi:MAG: hypothetical protein HYU67_03940 [Flavobacteriia bacterium]|nr:hypothetical protein [Flavobacteriia bacterium]